MATKVINISLPEELLREIDAAAAAEHRTRSELLREGAPLHQRPALAPAPGAGR